MAVMSKGLTDRVKVVICAKYIIQRDFLFLLLSTVYNAK